MSDGSIRVDVSIGKDKAIGDLAAVDKMCNNTAKNIQKLQQAVSLTSSKSAKTEINIDSKSGLKKAQTRLEKINEEISRIQAKSDEMLPYASTDEQATNILALEESETKKLVEEQQMLNSAVEEYTRKLSEAQAIKNGSSEIKDASAEVSGNLPDDSFMNRIRNAEQYNSALAQTKSRMEAIEAETTRISAHRGLNSADVLRANKEYQKLNSRLRILTANQRKFKGTASSSFLAAKKGAQSLGGSIKSGIKQMARYTLAIFGARSAFMAVKQAMSTYIDNNEELSNTITGLKGVVAEMVGPFVETVVNGLRYVMAYVNAFVKALTGIDFIARYNTKALKKQAKATQDNTKAQKDYNKAQLASFDTLNKLADNSTESDTTKDETSDVASTLSLPEVDSNALMEKLRSPLAMAIGLLGGAALVVLGILACCVGLWSVGIGLIVVGATIFAATVAVNWDAIKETLTSPLGMSIALIVGVALVVLGILACCAQMWVLGIGLIVAGVGLLAVTVALNWDEISNTIHQIFESPVSVFVGVSLVILGILLCCAQLWPLGLGLIAAGAGLLAGYAIVNKDAIKQWIADMWKGITSWWNAHVAPIFTKEYWFKKFSTIKDGAKAAINGLLSHIENAINWVVGKINGCSLTLPDWAQKATGISTIGFKLPYVHLPRLAKGGIVNNPGNGVNAVIGEAGAEAVLPLERNTEWMDALATKIASTIIGNGFNFNVKATGSMSQLIRLLKLEIEQDKRNSSAWG